MFNTTVRHVATFSRAPEMLGRNSEVAEEHRPEPLGSSKIETLAPSQ